ncbi:DUF1599 domain-containing protein [Olivibacter sitiensis]|uniref:DUF1599 domain-containing protein n=1 Tax=Olivibacter sitiensis TaxID=376470 RepID=UPI0004172272|nr:DUF1599 domain-containing protein [Olivibacter sitiensis]
MEITNSTSTEFDAVIGHCRNLFLKKAADYGTAWRIMRLPSITDQIFIKAQRIRTLEEKKVSKVGEDIPNEYVAIVNYCIIGIIQLQLDADAPEKLPLEEVSRLYQQAVTETKQLMSAKNHDYGEAWRDMRISSLTDLILMKIFRVKQIEDNEGQTLASEGIKANYQDMLNYAVFALIRLDFAKEASTGTLV